MNVFHADSLLKCKTAKSEVNVEVYRTVIKFCFRSRISALPASFKHYCHQVKKENTQSRCLFKYRIPTERAKPSNKVDGSYFTQKKLWSMIWECFFSNLHQAEVKSAQVSHRSMWYPLLPSCFSGLITEDTWTSENSK